MMNESLLEELLAARQARQPCALVTVAEVKGSVPRAAGAKMIVYLSGLTSGTIGGGKFENLVVADALACLRDNRTALKTFPLHEHDPASFGAICGGEATVLIEPQFLREALFLVGAGHCARAIARLALECGLSVSVIDDRSEQVEAMPPQVARVSATSVSEFMAQRTWSADDAIVLVSRNHELDRDALAAALRTAGYGYLGMIGSRRKVEQVFARLRELGLAADLPKVYAPIGLDIGADSPAEIAVSVLAEILSVLRNKGGGHLRSSGGEKSG